ncbi:hypothetical protein M430DRAFT_29466 [Amorphotheca resinae ATCC 22711]|uniref:Uncharacterized protein n=1 Tax=Amorphotheca resinae ATCC 22711 TaxID=857342 RepID=A0A2T3AW28_AMORE|nr:hypothetical protein M430DRAFT_29466 [Amorphotheca resinae ATCC 22711]PSS12882.1 hypothetical protein M430DRAFT_29466 [Amorphotheca resinae ATCC 22711]
MLEAKNMTAEALHFLDPRTRYFHEDVNFKYLDHEKKKWFQCGHSLIWRRGCEAQNSDCCPIRDCNCLYGRRSRPCEICVGRERLEQAARDHAQLLSSQAETKTPITTNREVQKEGEDSDNKAAGKEMSAADRLEAATAMLQLNSESEKEETVTHETQSTTALELLLQATQIDQAESISPAQKDELAGTVQTPYDNRDKEPAQN